MTDIPHLDQFLSEAIATDRESESGLDPDGLYGLYTSWCLITGTRKESPSALFDALSKGHRISAANNRLAMTGPAATDYILASAPTLMRQ